VSGRDEECWFYFNISSSNQHPTIELKWLYYFW
jgi:hypothetical protein